MAVYTMTFQEYFEAGFTIGNYPIWDESYRNVLNDKIKNHYLFREIGQETPGRFKHYLDTKMNEIMPYYNQLYNTTLKEYDISVVSETSETYNANAQTDSESSSTASTEQSGSAENSSTSSSEASTTGSATDTTKATGTSTNTTTYDNTTTNTNENLYSLTENRESDTPEGNLTTTEDGQLSAGYLTRASTTRNEQGGSSASNHTGTDTTENNSENNSESTSNTTTSSSGTANAENTSSSTTSGSSEASQTAKINNTSDYIKNITVKNPNLAVNTIEKLRKNIINIDMMIIEELGELFMQVY